MQPSQWIVICSGLESLSIEVQGWNWRIHQTTANISFLVVIYWCSALVRVLSDHLPDCWGWVAFLSEYNFRLSIVQVCSTKTLMLSLTVPASNVVMHQSEQGQPMLLQLSPCWYLSGPERFVHWWSTSLYSSPSTSSPSLFSFPPLLPLPPPSSPSCPDEVLHKKPFDYLTMASLKTVGFPSQILSRSFGSLQDKIWSRKPGFKATYTMACTFWHWEATQPPSVACTIHVIHSTLKPL